MIELSLPFWVSVAGPDLCSTANANSMTLEFLLQNKKQCLQQLQVSETSHCEVQLLYI